MRGPELTTAEIAQLDRQEAGHVGAQGAALILELRRLQVALERELQSDEVDDGNAAVHEPAVTAQAAATLIGNALGGSVIAASRHIGTFWRFLIAREHAEERTEGAFNKRLEHAFRSELKAGLRILTIAVAALGGWAALVPLSGAVVAPGVLVVESDLKKVQHPSGGIIAAINVKNGSRVRSGDLLLRLDETQARANNQVLSQQLAQVQARIARLVAERDGSAEIMAAKKAGDAGGDINGLLSSEQSLFSARALARESQKELLRNRVQQLQEQIAGLEAQNKSKTAQLELITSELGGVEELYAKGLATMMRLAGLKRDAARLDGERGQITSAMAEAKVKIGETEIQLLRIDQDFRAEIMKELREAQDKEAELKERTVAASDLLSRIEIRAPTSGTVHELAVHTIGGVISPGETLMEIVPDADELVIEARLPPQEIDQVHRGQAAHVRLSAFNQRTTPQLDGAVSYLSADLSRDKQTNTAYYTVRISLPASERRRTGDLQLVSGMPAEVFLQTISRTLLSYLFKPITDQLARMFNER